MNHSTGNSRLTAQTLQPGAARSRRGLTANHRFSQVEYPTGFPSERGMLPQLTIVISVEIPTIDLMR